MKRVIALFLVTIALIGVLPFGASATNEREIIYLEDGGRIEIYIENTYARAANTVSGSKTYKCYDSNGNVDWTAKLSATFAYSGAWYTCTTANCNVTISDSQWYVVSNNTIRSSNNAVTNLTMGRKYLGVTVEKPEYTIQLTCDTNGNLS